MTEVVHWDLAEEVLVGVGNRLIVILRLLLGSVPNSVEFQVLI